MLKSLRTILFAFICVSLIGCSNTTAAPVIPSTPAAQTPLSAAAQAEPAPSSLATLMPAATLTLTTTTRAVSSPDDISTSEEVLDSAVSNLINAGSFEMTAHEVRAYRIIDRSGETRVIYGEAEVKHSVIRSPALKIHSSYQYRYDPQAEFTPLDTYTYQDNGRYFTRNMDALGIGSAEELDPGHVEPIAGDVYQTLITFSDQARFLGESDGTAVYVLEHPQWYTLKSAIGFADLGFLFAQEDGEQLVEQYAADHYPGVKTVQFTIYVAVDERLITKVEVDDSDFMLSVWAEVDRGLIESGVKPENLTRYEVMDVNGALYQFYHYNQVEDFDLP